MADNAVSEDQQDLRRLLAFSSFLQAAALMMLFAGVALLMPAGQQVEALVPAFHSALSSHVLREPPVQLHAMASDASGIVWNGKTGTLFAVRNKNALIQELDTQGAVLRTVSMTGFADVEGITWLGGERFAIVEERDCSVWLLTITAETRALAKPFSPLFALPNLNGDGGNKGCEDLTWHAAARTFYLVKEKEPAMLLRVSGVDPFSGMAPQQPQLQEVPGYEVDTLGTDLSGLYFDERSAQLLVLSDESRRLTAVNMQGLRSAPLRLGLDLGMAWRRRELGSVVSQPEGVTTDDEGNLYVLSEPNLLYRFTR